ncbi:HERV-H LTR-associating protein 2 isoform X1 [Pseudoliparis swirei]|uniref:HERV-H LTR-associating protein 2 isoform X1 n=1 Tax=Pseudoliparis swirei TaxID=2059687 RepID=UPI0024BE17EC|nr:HERV-H LTR-associating protein 2 isoform X1 [Pseudoliparis swirei]
MAETQTLLVLLLVLLEKRLLTHSKVLLPDANVTCIIPDDCILPCSFRPTGTVVIHWYKQQIPVHSYYYNKDQFGLQNKHFSGRTCLFNLHIPHGNASLLLRRVKVQDKGRYKCYTSTRKGSQEIFINLEVKALIQSVVMEMTDELVTCSSHSIYPAPQVTWATDPPSAREALDNATLKTTDHKGLLALESTLRILGNLSSYTYFCSFTAADKTQVWTASRKNQEVMTQEEGHALSIPCIAPHSLQNFSLTWTFAVSSEPAVILRYETKTRLTFNLWEGLAELDQDSLLLGNGSLLLHKPGIEEQSGTYTCTLSGLQSRHVVQTRVNITVASMSVGEQSVQRSWWSTAASAAFFLFTVTVALPRCVRMRAMEARSASHRLNAAGFAVVGLHKHLNATASYVIGRRGVECSGPQLRWEVAAGGSPDDSTEASTIERGGNPGGPPGERNDGLLSSSSERDGLGNMDPGDHMS